MRVEHNLVAGMRWPGTFGGRRDTANVAYDAAISVSGAPGVVLRDNAVAGSERAGYTHDGLPCTDHTGIWANNVAHSVLVGVLLLPENQQPDCTAITGFIVYRADRYAIWSSGASDVTVRDVLVADSGIGAFIQRIGPSPVAHAAGACVVRYQNSVFVGESGVFACRSGAIPANDPNAQLTSSSAPWSPPGRRGIGWTSFTSSANKAPKKPFNGEMAYPTIAGRTYIEGER